jgi:Phage related hypothetical protein (DUF1799)
MEAFGASPAQIEEARRAILARAEPHPIWPENWRAVQVFCALGTQWRMAIGAGGSVWLGLRYESLPLVEARVRPTDGAPQPPPDVLFTQLRVLETTALEHLNNPSTR